MPSLMCFKCTPDLLLRSSSLEVDDRLQALLRREDLDLTFSGRSGSVQRSLSSLIANLIFHSLGVTPTEVRQRTVDVLVLILLRDHEQTILDALDDIRQGLRGLIVDESELPLQSSLSVLIRTVQLIEQIPTLVLLSGIRGHQSCSCISGIHGIFILLAFTRPWLFTWLGRCGF